MINQIQQETQKHMQKCIENFTKKIKKIRNHHISPDLISDILIKYYNAYLPLKKLAHITKENNNTLVITPFDNITIPFIIKTILKLNVGTNPYSVEEKIYLPFPQITQENRKHLIKSVRNEAEKYKVSIRNIRKKMNEKIKKIKKQNAIQNDKYHKLQIAIQNITNQNIQHINQISIKKEKNIKET
ncbi:MAG: ribosome-recycling factor [Candidatus Westeberhardia cardiocondylae]|nr:ribosome-recycling factor [Candidatus Westeberhardia cardiocondylae]